MEAWRSAARPPLLRGVRPEQIVFTDTYESQRLLDSASPELNEPPESSALQASVTAVRLPQEFFSRAATVAAHRDPRRWDLLYRVAFRLAHGEAGLLEDPVDDDVRRLAVLEKQVARDIHKSHAFVRFNKVRSEAGEDRFVAFYRPDHHILRLTTPFFMERFGAMDWSILTPDESAHCTSGKLSYSPGVQTAAKQATGDDLVGLWQTYYASIFNPARIKLDAMHKEMPRRFWKHLPETELIDELLTEAPARVSRMLAHQVVDHPGAAAWVPTIAAPGRVELPQLKAAISGCRGCPICPKASGPVFGLGPANSPIMLVGEQPGDVEDRQGVPFMGPAGDMLNRALAMAGVPRDAIYVTNAVKGFKYEPRGAEAAGGARRIHAKPDSREIHACRPWLVAELLAVRPSVIVALGNTAAHSLLGPTVKVGRHKGQRLRHDSGAEVVVTYHPSAILRVPDKQAAHAMLQELAESLRVSAGIAACRRQDGGD